MLFQKAALFDSMTRPRQRRLSHSRGRTGLRIEDPRASGPDCSRWSGCVTRRSSCPPSSLGECASEPRLARALALEPEVMLYDEPTTGLDPVVAQRINVLIRDLQQRLGLSGVVVTHDLHCAFHVADRIAFLHDGRIAFIGTPEETRRSSQPSTARVPRRRRLNRSQETNADFITTNGPRGCHRAGRVDARHAGYVLDRPRAALLGAQASLRDPLRSHQRTPGWLARELDRRRHRVGAERVVFR